MQTDVECDAIKEVELIVQPKNEKVIERTDLAECNAMLNSGPSKRSRVLRGIELLVHIQVVVRFPKYANMKIFQSSLLIIIVGVYLIK